MRSHPLHSLHGAVALNGRAAALQADGSGFESRWLHAVQQTHRGRWQSGNALGCKPSAFGHRWFKSISSHAIHVSIVSTARLLPSKQAFRVRIPVLTPRRCSSTEEQLSCKQLIGVRLLGPAHRCNSAVECLSLKEDAEGSIPSACTKHASVTQRQSGRLLTETLRVRISPLVRTGSSAWPERLVYTQRGGSSNLSSCTQGPFVQRKDA